MNVSLGRYQCTRKKKSILHRFQSGVTLIELIVVLLVVSVIGAFSVEFIASTVEGYNQSINRGRLITQGRQALERMSRQLRASVPNSIRVRVISGLSCVEFVPVAGGGNYLADVPDAVNLAPPISSLTTGGYSVDFGTATRVLIAPMSAGEIYGGSAVAVNLNAALAEGSSGTTLNIAAHQFLRNSVSRRFYLAGTAQAFCYTGSQLRYYSNSGVVAANGGDVVADDVTAAVPFVVSNGSEVRNTLVTIRVNFRRGGESLTLNREALIRNVP